MSNVSLSWVVLFTDSAVALKALPSETDLTVSDNCGRLSLNYQSVAALPNPSLDTAGNSNKKIKKLPEMKFLTEAGCVCISL